MKDQPLARQATHLRTIQLPGKKRTAKPELTQADKLFLLYILGYEIGSGADGVFGNGDEITDKKGLEHAKRLVQKLNDGI